MPLRHVCAASAEIGLRTYGVVVLVRNGGILIVETGATLDANASMHANVAGRFYPADDYWLPSVRTLEYWMRFLHLEPLDGAFLHHRVVDGLPVIRVAVACRALESFQATPQDTWMHRQNKGLFDADFQEYVNWEEVMSDRPPVPNTHSGGHIAYHPGNSELSQLMLADR